MSTGGPISQLSCPSFQRLSTSLRTPAAASSTRPAPSSLSSSHACPRTLPHRLWSTLRTIRGISPELTNSATNQSQLTFSITFFFPPVGAYMHPRSPVVLSRLHPPTPIERIPPSSSTPNSAFVSDVVMTAPASRYVPHLHLQEL